MKGEGKRIDRVRTGENIRRLSMERGLRIVDLQEIFGFGTPQAIYKWMSGACLPSLDNLVLLSRVLGVSVDEILVKT